MKKTLLTTGLMAFAFGTFAQFTPNRLVVSQFSDAATEAGKATAVTLVQFPISGGASTYSLALPTTNGTGTNAFAGKGGSFTEGLVTLSSNGAYLSLFGYNLTPGSAPATTTPYERRVVARVAADGTINSTTLFQGSTSGTVGLPRTVITDDGTGFWVGSSGTGGVRYALLGSDGIATTGTGYGTAVTSTTDLGALRSLNIFNGQLYETTTGSKLHFATVSQGSNTLPKDFGTSPTTTTVTALPGFDATTPPSPNQSLILKSTVGVGAPDVIYVANDASSLIEKYVLVSGTWTAQGTVTASGPVRAITGRIVGGTAFIYAITAATGASTLITITDAAPLTSTISTLTNAPVVLATAPTDNAFKGIAFTPGSTTGTVTTLPIKLSSFTGKSGLNGVQLSWTTSVEKNNNYFDVLRSSNGANFEKIGRVAGNGNSDVAINYSFLDRSALTGANYYKLNQVDHDGKSEVYGPVVVSLNGKVASIAVYANKASGQINVNVQTNKSGAGVLMILNTDGKIVSKQKVNLQAGNNLVTVNNLNIGSGVHIATLVFDGETLTKKFIVQ